MARVDGRYRRALNLEDVRNMVESGRVEPAKLRELLAGIEAELYRFPAVDPPSLRAAVETLGDPA